MQIKCNLKQILDERDISIRQLSNEIGISFESVRRLANNDTTQYSKNTMEKICEHLKIGLCDLLILSDYERED